MYTWLINLDKLIKLTKLSGMTETTSTDHLTLLFILSGKKQASRCKNSDFERFAEQK